MTMITIASAASLDNALVISQLTNVISIQNKEAMESNNLHSKEIESQVKREEKKKNRTKKIHPAIMNMLQRAAATHKNDKKEEIAPTCLRFVNAKNIGLAQYKLIHQFKEGGFPYVTFALGTTQALFHRKIPLHRLKHTKQFHHLCIMQTRTKLCQPADGLPDLPFGPRTRSEGVSQ
jgi:hypothetical protein